MPSISATCLALSLALLIPGTPSGGPDQLEHAPPTNGVLRREHSVRHSLTARALRLKNAQGEHLGEGGFDVVSRLELLASDRVLEPAPLRPQKLRRAFDRARLNVDVGVLQPGGEAARPYKLASTGVFEGKSVVFTWVEEEQGYGRYYDEEEGVEEDLAWLLVDLDLAAFLPPDPVEPDATWRVDPLALRHVVGPGGYLGFDLTQIGDVPLGRALRGGMGTHIYEAFGELAEGEVKATYRGRREVDGRELAAIELVFQAKVRADLTALMNLARTTGEIDGGLEIEKYLLELELEGSGEILWDVAGRHLARSTFSGEEVVRASMQILTAGDGQVHEQVMELGGSFESVASVRFEPDGETAPEPTDKR